MSLTESDYKRMKRGATAPHFSLPATDGKTYTLNDFKGCKALLIVFMCNHCPYVKPKIEEMKRIAKDYKAQGLAMVSINSNDALSHPDDSFESMKRMSKEKQLNFPYLYDESQEVAKAYGATCTPDPFLFDSNFKLVFHSRIDDTHGADPIKKHEMHNAIGGFLSEGEVSLKEKPSMGCNIKWKL